MFIAIFLVLCGVFYFWLKWNFSYWKRHHVPGPEPSLIVGNLGKVITQKDHIGLMADAWYKKYSNAPYVGYYKVFTPAIMVRDVELVKNVLIKDFTSFLSNDVTTNDDPNDLLSGNPFIQTDEQKWKLSRAIMSPMFTTNKMKSILPLMQSACDKLIKYIERQGSDTDIDSKSLSAKFTTENVVTCAFSMDANCFDDPNCEFRRMGKKIFQPSFWMGMKFMTFFFLPFLVKFFSFSFIPKDVDKWARNLMRENMKSRQNKKLQHEDMIQIMQSFQERHNMTDDQVIGHAMSFFVDGYETSSSVLSFALWQIARDSKVQDTLYQEISTILAKHDGQLSYEAINEMHYLDCVIQETLRLDSVGLTLHKLCTKPYQMPPLPGQKEGFVLQPGTPILIPVYAIHHDPEFYPNPKVFDPLRFTEEEKQKRPKCTYLPFGEGPRICVGMKFGLLQTKMALVSIVRNFTITESPNCKPFVVDVRALLYQTLHPLILNFAKRK
ncbi:Cytochrome P450 [Sergentomyia squamirostris]